MFNFKKKFLADNKKKWFITGGAGFIGSHLVNLLVSANFPVTVYDNLSSGNIDFLKEYIKKKKIRFYQADILDRKRLTQAMKGHQIVCHLASNTDIAGGFYQTRMDLDNDVIGTCNVLEAMVKNNISDLLFSSTGAVYGESIKGIFQEDAGPLIPLSLYAAGKIASEAFICAYSSLFGLQSFIFRFGNVIGGRINHGAIYDFIQKLKKDNQTLEILGRGIGEKNYFLVEECLSGILYTYYKTKDGPFPYIINLGADSTTKVMDIAKIVISELGLKKVRFKFTGTERGWPGDQPIVLLDTTKIRQLGWYCKRTSDEAVRICTRRLLGKESYQLSINNFFKL